MLMCRSVQALQAMLRCTIGRQNFSQPPARNGTGSTERSCVFVRASTGLELHDAALWSRLLNASTAIIHVIPPMAPLTQMPRKYETT